MTAERVKAVLADGVLRDGAVSLTAEEIAQLVRRSHRTLEAVKEGVAKADLLQHLMIGEYRLTFTYYALRWRWPKARAKMLFRSLGLLGHPNLELPGGDA